MHFLRLVRSRHFTRTDGPDRFVRDDDVLPIRGGDHIIHGLELVSADVQRGAGFALLQLSPMQRATCKPLDNAYFVFSPINSFVSPQSARRSLCPRITHGICASTNISALTSPVNAPPRPPSNFERRRYTSSVQVGLHARQKDERRRDVHVNVGINLTGIQFLHERLDGFRGTVTLPVSADDKLPARARRDAALALLASNEFSGQSSRHHSPRASAASSPVHRVVRSSVVPPPRLVSSSSSLLLSRRSPLDNKNPSRSRRPRPSS